MPLSSALTRFREIPNLDRSKAPVLFDDLGARVFTNESIYPAHISTSETAYRLLGLFRLWNAIEYYSPYKDIMDYDWNEMLIEYIPKMIERTDRESYYLTLFAMSAKVNDGHVYFDNETPVLNARFGGDYNSSVIIGSGGEQIALPVVFERAEGQIVVRKIIGNRFLQPGDVVLSIGGVGISEIIEERKQFIAVPNDEKLKRVLPYLPLYKSSAPEVTVLRNGEEFTGTVRAIRWNSASFEDPYYESIKKSHELLENNIGLINPLLFSYDQVSAVMEEFSGTSGLIIDLRQYPTSPAMLLMPEYLLNEIEPYALWSIPFIPVLGLFLDASIAYADPGLRISDDEYAALGLEPSESAEPYFYDRQVAILMNQKSQSYGETMIMCLRTGPNVTVIGSNSIGANGNVAYLPLPCGATMTFSSVGTYTPDGGQTQRIGLIPDIYVERTIDGIRDGRDELMEAAIEFLLGA